MPIVSIIRVVDFRASKGHRLVGSQQALLVHPSSTRFLQSTVRFWALEGAELRLGWWEDRVSGL